MVRPGRAAAREGVGQGLRWSDLAERPRPLDELEHVALAVGEEGDPAAAVERARLALELDPLAGQRPAGGLEVGDGERQVAPAGVVARALDARDVAGGDDLDGRSAAGR